MVVDGSRQARKHKVSSSGTASPTSYGEGMTPIEKIFLDAALASPETIILVEGAVGPHRIQERACLQHGDWWMHQSCILLASEVPYGRWRADFVVETYGDPKHFGRPVSVFIECDGHEFHERTKEQAARDKSRDRAFQRYAPTMRFTGSELFSNAGDCWQEVLDMLDVLTLDRAMDYRRARIDVLMDAMAHDEAMSQPAHSIACFAVHFKHRFTQADLLCRGVTQETFSSVTKELAPYFKLSVDTDGKFVFRPHAKWVRS